MIDKLMRLCGDHLGEENANRPWDQLSGVRYEETSLTGQQKIEVVGGEKLIQLACNKNFFLERWDRVHSAEMGNGTCDLLVT